MQVKGKSGQILVLVLLVVVVVLAVGLSVASRNLTNLKTSSQAEQSQRAFTAAEGGVEDVLAKLNGVANVITQPGGTISNGCTSGGDDTANCTSSGTDTSITSTIKVKATKGYEKTIEPGEVAQLNLSGYPAGSTINIDWRKASDPDFATLEFILVCDGGPSTCYGQAFTGVFGQFRDAKRTGTPSGTGTDSVSPCSTTGVSVGYTCRTSFLLPASPNPSNLKILRIKPFWNRTTINVIPSNVGAFPVQTYEITSTATTDTGVSRKVEVRREALPQLPAIFDYALYSGGDIVK